MQDGDCRAAWGGGLFNWVLPTGWGGREGLGHRCKTVTQRFISLRVGLCLLFEPESPTDKKEGMKKEYMEDGAGGESG